MLGTRAREGDELRLDGRLIRRRAPAVVGVLLCHRSPGEPLAGFADRLPQRSGRRFISVSPMPLADGGLELLTADGALAARLQRAVGTLEMEVSVRVRGEIDEAQQRSLLAAGQSDGARVGALEALGGEGTNRWYRLTTVGLSGAQLRALLERAGVTPIRALRTRLGSLSLPRTLLRGRWRSLEPGELSALLGSPGSGP